MFIVSVAGVAAVFDCVCIVVMGQRRASVAGVAAVFIYDCVSYRLGKNHFTKSEKKSMKKKSEKKELYTA